MIPPIMVVIHQEYIRAKNIQNRLKQRGYDVPTIVLSCEEALAIIDEIKPDVVLLDAEMKGSPDSLEIADRVQTDLHIPIILLTAHPHSSILYKEKYYCCSNEPFHEKELLLMIDLVLSKQSLKNGQSEQEQFLLEIIKKSSDGVITIDSKKQILFMNTRAEELTGWKFEETQNVCFSRIIRVAEKNINGRNYCQLSKLIGQELRLHLNNHHLVSKDSREIPIDVLATPFKNGQENATRLLVVLKRTRQLVQSKRICF